MRTGRIVGVLALVAIVGALGYWAGRVALEPPEDPVDGGRSHILYTVAVDTVGRSFSFTAIGQWESAPVGRSGASGVVTSVDISPGDLVTTGQVIYGFGLRPVVAAEGDVPMFRALDLRSEGTDVAQLQQLLGDLGFYEGETDGSFGTSTRTAVRRWQASLGVEDDGVVAAGDIVFMPSLPARVVLEDSVVTGARLAEGEITVLGLPEEPEFHIPLAPEQASLVPLDAAVEISFADGVWHGRVDKAVETDFELHLIVTGVDGAALCGNECARWVDLTAPTNFRANVIVVPETTGVAVPVAGISTDAGNNSLVTLHDGATTPVTVVASADGLAIVEGIDEGTQIRLRGEE